MIAVAAVAAFALTVGLSGDARLGWMVAAGGFLLLALVHLRRLWLLTRWLENPVEPEPPRAYGAWDDLHAQLHHSRRKASERIAELTGGLERMQKAVRALPEGVVLLDGDRISWCNDVAGVHFGVDPLQDVGRPITHLVRIPALRDYLARGDFEHTIVIETPGDDARTLSVQVVDYGDWQRVLLSRDITQFQRIERMRREFVANVSHELRTPLTVIAGFVETLREESDPVAARRYLDLMAGQSDRMQRLVEDLLTLSTLESAPAPPISERVVMAALLDRLGADARALSNGRHRIVVEPPAALDLAGSENELASAFGNLVSNAVRYTPEGGTVTLRWRQTPSGAAFEVADTGIGIEAKHIPRLTERFYRVDRGRSRETGGTGLGLAIVKHALARHGATLKVESEPGRGSLFSAGFSGPRVKTATS